MNSRLTIFSISVLFFLIACPSRSCFAQAASKKKISRGQNKKAIPDIVGLRLGDAKTVLRASGINIGAIVYGQIYKADTLDEFVLYRQYPPSKNADSSINYVGKNLLVDVWVENRRVNADSLIQNTRNIKGARRNDL